MVDPKGDCQLVKSDNCWVAPTLLKPANVLLAKASNLGKLLLRQALFLSEPPNVLSD